MNDATFDANAIAEMALQLHHEPSSAETVERVLDYARQAVGCDFASVAFFNKKSGSIDTAAATDPLIEKLERAQHDRNHGPNLETNDEGFTILVDDTARDDRWPEWAALLTDNGIRSFLSTRLSTTDETLGTLNLYARDPYQFDSDDRAVAHVLARHAAIAIASARNDENLWVAVDARKVIGQAQGILMERYDLDPDRAFAVLVRYSQDNNVKLRDVARQLIETRSLPTAPASP